MQSASVAVTGGTGSFGQTVVRDLLAKDVGRVHVLSRDEEKQDAMRRKIDDPRVKYYIGDVRDLGSVENALRGVDYVFHAAALKQVPSCEFFPDQAVQTNVRGSHNVIEAARRVGVKSVVCLSTDKAVYPVNAMGMSKALMEKTAQAFARNNPGSTTKVSITRYGNVMHSRGSVIPVFVQQVLAGKPLTITEPRMTRYLMTLEQSVDLVYYAFNHAEAGDLYVWKAPATTIEILARAVASLLGNDNPEIKVIGIRHGEKMHETLLSREELVTAEDQGDYFRVPLDARSLQYEMYFDQGSDNLARTHDYTSENTRQLTLDETKQLLLQIPQIQRLMGADA